MRKTTIIGSILGLMLLGNAVVAQQLKASGSAEDVSIYRDIGGRWTRLSSDRALGPTIVAGQTVRLRIASTNNRGKLIVGVDDVNIPRLASGGGKLYVGTDVGVFVEPCDARASAPGSTVSHGFGYAALTVGGASHIYEWKTEPGWKGTCRLLTVKLSNGRELRAKFRFE